MLQPGYIPKGFHTVNPYLIVTDSARLIEFAKAVFDAEEVLRVAEPGGRIRHAEIRIGDSPVEIADGCDEWPSLPASLHIYVSNVDEVYLRALAAGAELLLEPKDQFYGERSASVRDPLGNIWHIATKTEELSIEEMQQRARQHMSNE